MSTDPKRKEVYEWRECIEDACGHKKFYISVAEKEYFDSKVDEKSGRQFELPKRCYPCRIKRRQQGGKGSNEQAQ